MFYEIADFFVLDICALSLYFAQKLLSKAKFARRCYNCKTLLQTPKVSQTLSSSIGKGLNDDYPCPHHMASPLFRAITWPVTDPRLSSPSPFHLLQIERTISYFLPLTPSTNRWQLFLTFFEQLEGRQQ